MLVCGHLAVTLRFQGISTGKYHAARDDQQRAVGGGCVRAGRSSGDLAHPLVYCPELHFSEFTSAVADMKNSVAVSNRARICSDPHCTEPGSVLLHTEQSEDLFCSPLNRARICSAPHWTERGSVLLHTEQSEDLFCSHCTEPGSVLLPTVQS